MNAFIFWPADQYNGTVSWCLLNLFADSTCYHNVGLSLTIKYWFALPGYMGPYITLDFMELTDNEEVILNLEPPSPVSQADRDRAEPELDQIAGTWHTENAVPIPSIVVLALEPVVVQRTTGDIIPPVKLVAGRPCSCSRPGINTCIRRLRTGQRVVRYTRFRSYDRKEIWERLTERVIGQNSALGYNGPNKGATEIV